MQVTTSAHAEPSRMALQIAAPIWSALLDCLACGSLLQVSLKPPALPLHHLPHAST